MRDKDKRRLFGLAVRNEAVWRILERHFGAITDVVPLWNVVEEDETDNKELEDLQARKETAVRFLLFF